MPKRMYKKGGKKVKKGRKKIKSSRGLTGRRGARY